MQSLSRCLVTMGGAGEEALEQQITAADLSTAMISNWTSDGRANQRKAWGGVGSW